MVKKFLDNLEQKSKIFFDSIADIVCLEEFNCFKKKYISKKDGVLLELTNLFQKLPLDQKKTVGRALVDFKAEVHSALAQKQNALFLSNSGFPSPEVFDPGLLKKKKLVGSLHPYAVSYNIIYSFFNSLNFECIDGSVLTTEYDNFTSLNVPQGHPAREDSDTFWVDQKQFLLRTHTSNIQVSEAKKRKPPFGLISTGLVYRNESTDMTHDIMFSQCEGLFFGDSASISSLLFTLKSFLNIFFEKNNLLVRARPGIFPFVEPGLEIDFECPFCFDGCNVCKDTRWIEVGGAGMVHSFVKKEMGFSDTQKGWAFGLGLTRLVMLKYHFNDIRKLHQQ